MVVGNTSSETFPVISTMPSFVVNPVAMLRDDVLAAANKLDEFFLYVMRRGSGFPDWSVDELIAAVELVRAANKRRYFDGAAILWPSRECIERAWAHQVAGDDSENMPPVRIHLTDCGELYYEI